MKRIEFELDAQPGRTITVEVEEPLQPGLTPVSRGSTFEKAEESFESAIARLEPVMTGVVSSVRKLAQAPDDVTIEFGVTFDAKSGIVISSFGVQASLKVTLTWRAADDGESR